MQSAGADQYTFHVEATDNPAECVRKIREAGMKASHSYYIQTFLNYHVFPICGAIVLLYYF